MHKDGGRGGGGEWRGEEGARRLGSEGQKAKSIGHDHVF